ncbi:MAG: Fe-S cluster assembly protein SufD [Bacteroidia bacterium]|nr:Fe-S cluster assembly protein SufD [Bacteroidia bacterium]
MALTSEKSGKKRTVAGEDELFKNSGVAGKWLGEIEQRLGDTNPLIKHIQNNAAKEFARTGLPGRRDEDYKYTNIRQYLQEDFVARNGQENISVELIKPLLLNNSVNLVFINDKYVPGLSVTENLPEGIAAGDFYFNKDRVHDKAAQHFNKAAGESKNPMALLNTALAGNGFYIFVPKNFILDVPVHIIHIITGEVKSLYNPRNLVYLEENSQLTLIESYHTVGDCKQVFTNSLTELFVEDNAVLENYILQDEGAGSYHSDSRFLSIGRGGKSNCVTVSLNGIILRNDSNVLIHGEHAEAHLNGLFLLKGNDHTDNHTLVEHLAPNCSSKELYKGIIGDSATGVFNGKIYVHPEAQKTDAYQSNKNVLTGDKATIDTKPQLEIYADDVRCSHGTSTGKLNEEALFYLQSRGLNKQLAKKVLLQAFAKEVSNTIKNEAFRTFIEKKIQEKLI